MSDSSRHDRFRLMALLSLATITALGSYWLVEVLRQGLPLSASANPHNEPDYYVDQFQFVRVASNGQPRYMMSGKSLVHRPVTDQSDIKDAQLLSFNAEQAPLKVNANLAQLSHKKNTMELAGNVTVVRTDRPDVPGWNLKSEALTLLPDEDKLLTDQAVVLNNGRSVTNAIGMQIDNTKGTLKLNKQVHGVFQPPLATPSTKAK